MFSSPTMQAIHRANVLLSSMVRYGCAGYGLTTVKNCESSGDGGVGGRLTMFSCVTVVVNGDERVGQGHLTAAFAHYKGRGRCVARFVYGLGDAVAVAFHDP